MAITKQILKTGTFVDANGNKCTFDEARLDAIAANFNAENGLNKMGNPVPLCIAHPATDTPAFGWVAKVFRKGSELWAEFKDVNEKMQRWLADKAFKTVSSALIGDNLRHVGVLGAWPPAVSAMKDFELQGYAIAGAECFKSDADFTEIEFTNQQTGDNKMSKTIEELSAELGTLKSTISEIEAKNVTLSEDKEAAVTEAETVKAENEELKKENETVKAENAAFKLSAATAEEAAADLADSAEIDKLIEAHKVLPGEKEALALSLKALRNSEEKEFELSAGKKEKMTPREFFLSKQNERPVIELSAELFSKEKHSDAKTGTTKIEAAVNAELAANPKLNKNDAMRNVLKEKPELNNPEIGNSPVE